MFLFNSAMSKLKQWFRNLSDLPQTVPLRLQKRQDDCALACLAMMVEYLNMPADRRAALPRINGYGRALTIGELLNIAGNLGMSTKTQRLTVAETKKLKGPAVLHWCDNHFVVLAWQSRAGVVINDPARGRQFMNWQAFARHYSGVCIEFIRPPSLFSQDAVSSDSYQEIPPRLL